MESRGDAGAAVGDGRARDAGAAAPKQETAQVACAVN